MRTGEPKIFFHGSNLCHYKWLSVYDEITPSHHYRITPLHNYIREFDLHCCLGPHKGLGQACQNLKRIFRHKTEFQWNGILHAHFKFINIGVVEIQPLGFVHQFRKYQSWMLDVKKVDDVKVLYRCFCAESDGGLVAASSTSSRWEGSRPGRRWGRARSWTGSTASPPPPSSLGPSSPGIGWGGNYDNIYCAERF